MLTSLKKKRYMLTLNSMSINTVASIIKSKRKSHYYNINF